MLFSCGHKDNFSGIWLDKEHEKNIINITYDGENYFLKTAGKKTLVKLEDGLLNIKGEYAGIDENDILLIGGKEFIKLENSKTSGFLGDWEGCGVSYGSDGPIKGDCKSYCTIKLIEEDVILTDLCSSEDYVLHLTKNGDMQATLNYSYKKSNKLKLTVKEDGALFWSDPMAHRLYNKINDLDEITKSLESDWTDERDRKKYKTVKIGDQIWLAEDFQYETNEGTVKKLEYMESIDTNKYIWYSQSAAIKHCPKGWHLPSKGEWEQLLVNINSDVKVKEMVGGEKFHTYYGNLFSLIEETAWEKIESQNKYGMSIRPSYLDRGAQAISFATSSKYPNGDPYYFHINDNKSSIDGERIDGVGMFFRGSKYSIQHYSVRYIRDICH